MVKGNTVLIIGNGAREHALSYAYEKSPHVKRIIIAGSHRNNFIAYRREKEVFIDDSRKPVEDLYRVIQCAQHWKADLVDVSTDEAIAAGVVDALQKKGIPVFGPTKKAARIEWDKAWSRNFMQHHNIPHPNFRTFSFRTSESEESCKEYLRQIYGSTPNQKLFVKASGLCKGKGALKASSLEEALKRVGQMESFGVAGIEFVIESAIEGEEFSSYAMTDGKTVLSLPSGQDHKTALNFDEGEQTGGMGVVSPAMITKDREKEIEKIFMESAVKGLEKDGHLYQGILYLGGTVQNDTQVDYFPRDKNQHSETRMENLLFAIEYNARWGDPEAQAILPGIKNDYFELAMAVVNQTLRKVQIHHDGKTRACVVAALRGYPQQRNFTGVLYPKPDECPMARITGLERVMKLPYITVYGGNIFVHVVGKDALAFFANQGRILNIVGEGKDVLQARQRAYEAMAMLSFMGNNLQYRTDIGWRDLQRFHGEEKRKLYKPIIFTPQ